MERVCAPGGHGTAEDVFEDRPYRVAGKTGNSTGHLTRRRLSRATGPPLPAISQPKTGLYNRSGGATAHRTRLLRWGRSRTCFPRHRRPPPRHAPRPGRAESGLLAELPRLPVSMNGSANTLTSLYETLGLPFSIDTTENGELPSHVAASTSDGLVTLTPRTVSESSIPDVRGMSLRDAVKAPRDKGHAGRHQWSRDRAPTKHCPGNCAPPRSNHPARTVMKLLKDILYGARITEVVGSTHVAIESVVADSRQVKPFGCFVAIPGTAVDGHDHIPAAARAGAAAIVCEHLPAEARPQRPCGLRAGR